VGPTTPPGTLVSEIPPMKRSTSSTSLEKSSWSELENIAVLNIKKTAKLIKILVSIFGYVVLALLEVLDFALKFV